MAEVRVKAKDEAEAFEIAKSWAEIEACLEQLTPEIIDKEVDPGEFYTVVPHDGSEPFHIDVTKARNLVKNHHAAFYRTDCPLTEQLVSYLLTDGGIEDTAVDRLDADFEWDEPALAFSWEKDGKTTAIQVFDGSHRIIKAAQRGDSEFPAAICSLEFAKKQLAFRFENENINKIMELMTKHNFEFREVIHQAKKEGRL